MDERPKFNNFMRSSSAEFLRMLWIFVLPMIRCTTVLVGAFIIYDFLRMLSLAPSLLPFSWKENCVGSINSSSLLICVEKEKALSMGSSCYAGAVLLLVVGSRSPPFACLQDGGSLGLF